MNIINERNIKIWSTIGARATLGIAALELAKTMDSLMVLTCDVSTSAGLDRYRKTYPEKYLDLGIAEQNMIGGLGSAIAEHKSSLKKSPKQLFLGVKDTYSKGGDYKFLQDKHRLTTEKILEDILSNIN